MHNEHWLTSTATRIRASQYYTHTQEFIPILRTAGTRTCLRMRRIVTDIYIYYT